MIKLTTQKDKNFYYIVVNGQRLIKSETKERHFAQLNFYKDQIKKGGK